MIPALALTTHGHALAVEGLARIATGEREAGLAILRRAWPKLTDDVPAGQTNLAVLACATAEFLGHPVAGRLREIFAESAAWHRGPFEGLSVMYSGISRAAMEALALKADDAWVREGARAWLRREMVILALHALRRSARDLAVLLPCGRIYGLEQIGAAWLPLFRPAQPARRGRKAIPAQPGGVRSPSAEYAVHALLGGTAEGWREKPTARYWGPGRDGSESWIWRLCSDLPGLLFSPAELAALRAWVDERAWSADLAALVAPLRLGDSTLRLFAWRGGLVSGCTLPGAYGGGDNTAQPLVRGDSETEQFIVREPPCGSAYQGAGRWLVTGARSADLVVDSRIPAAVEIVIDGAGGRRADAAGAATPAPPAPPALPAVAGSLLAAVRELRRAVEGAAKPTARRDLIEDGLSRLIHDHPQQTPPLATARQDLLDAERAASKGEIRQPRRRELSAAAWERLEAALADS